MVVALGVEVISRKVLEKGAVLVVSSQVLPCFLRLRRELDRWSKNLSMSAMNSSKMGLVALVGALGVVALGGTIGCAFVAVFFSCRR